MLYILGIGHDDILEVVSPAFPNKMVHRLADTVVHLPIDF